MSQKSRLLGLSVQTEKIKKRGKDMYLFEAKYFNVETEKQRVQALEIDSTPFENEVDIYTHAMKIAYEFTNVDEIFDSIEFIAG